MCAYVHTHMSESGVNVCTVVRLARRISEMLMRLGQGEGSQGPGWLMDVPKAEGGKQLWPISQQTAQLP